MLVPGDCPYKMDARPNKPGALILPQILGFYLPTSIPISIAPTMDFLKRELEKKRKSLADDFAGKKILKRSEIDQKNIQKLREAEKQKTQTPTPSSAAAASTSSSTPASTSLPPALAAAAAKKPADTPLSDIDDLVLPRHETIRRLRILKQPITLFGEDDDARLDRLKQTLKHGVLEIDDEMTEGQTNDFLRDIYEIRKRQKASTFHQDQPKHKRGEDEGADDGNGDGEKDGSGDGATDGGDGDKDGKRMKANFQELCSEDKILVFFKRLLNEWHQELEEMPEAEKRTAKGKSLVATYKQCARYLTPLFKFCRKKVLGDDIRRGLLVVVDCCMKRDYLAAMDQYIKLAIGNAPWPIGVTMVGIHERSAREKIYTNSVAHIMNDETTRKYLQSVKRLMTFCQRLYPAMPSKSVEFNSLANGSDLRSLLAEEEERGASDGRLRLMPAPQE